MSCSRTSAALVVVAACLVAGCGGGSSHSQPAPSTRTATPGASAPTQDEALKRAVRSALQANAKLSLYVLWHNAVPAWARRSTRGPALAELRTSAAGRRARGIRIRTVAPRYEVLGVQLDASYLRATALVRDRDLVRPYKGGRAMGRAIHLNERAQIELHRDGRAERFVVWKVVDAH